MKPGDRVLVGSGQKAHLLIWLARNVYLGNYGHVACGDSINEEVRPAPPEVPDCELCATRRPQR